MRTKNIIYLSNTNEEVKNIGGKGYGLQELIKGGFNVPNGFILTTDFFDNFINHNDIGVKINELISSIIDSNDLIKINQTSKNIQELILNSKITENEEEDIFKIYNKLKLNKVAVRSSATGEDSKNNTWAGQLDSILNADESNIIYCIKLVWASLYSTRALFYKIKKGIKQNLSTAIVIQKMINSEKSGIIFTSNPVDGNSNEIFIESAYGLGEDIVSGKNIPSNYILSKNNGKTKSKNLEQGEILNTREVSDLYKLSINIEKHFLYPCDIEWGIEKGDIYVLQCRPITTK